MSKSCPICGENLVSDGTREFCTGDQCGNGSPRDAFDRWWAGLEKTSTHLGTEYGLVDSVNSCVREDVARAIWEAARKGFR